MLRSLVVLLALTSVQSQLLACSCGGEEFVIRGLEQEGLSVPGPDVFLGRVVDWRTPKEAAIEPIEVFRGGNGTRVLRQDARYDNTSCAAGFLPNEEFVYFPDKNNLIGFCSKLPATQRLLEALRAASGRRPK